MEILIKNPKNLSSKKSDFLKKLRNVDESAGEHAHNDISKNNHQATEIQNQVSLLHL